MTRMSLLALVLLGSEGVRILDLLIYQLSNQLFVQSCSLTLTHQLSNVHSTLKCEDYGCNCLQ